MAGCLDSTLAGGTGLGLLGKDMVYVYCCWLGDEIGGEGERRAFHGTARPRRLILIDLDCPGAAVGGGACFLAEFSLLFLGVVNGCIQQLRSSQPSGMPVVLWGFRSVLG